MSGKNYQVSGGWAEDGARPTVPSGQIDENGPEELGKRQKVPEKAGFRAPEPGSATSVKTGSGVRGPPSKDYGDG